MLLFVVIYFAEQIVLGAESRLSSQLLRDIIEIIAEGAGEQDLFLTKTVDELLWGYDDPIFSAVHKFEPSIPAQFSLQVSILDTCSGVIFHYTWKSKGLQL